MHKQQWKKNDSKQTKITNHYRQLKKEFQEQQEQKIALYLDRIKHLKSEQIIQNSEQTGSKEIKKVNPFFTKIDRHYGSFAGKFLGNTLKVFNSLHHPFKEIKPLGKHGTGCRRKTYSCPAFTVILYSNGTIEVKPTRKKGLNPNVLQADAFDKRTKCAKFLSKRGLVLSQRWKLNRFFKYGYKDKAASFVQHEYQGKDRSMDSTPDPDSIDNHSCKACERDLRLSSEQSFKIAVENAKSVGLSEADGEKFKEKVAETRAKAPEILHSLEEKLAATVEANMETANASRLLGKNMELHVGIMRDIRYTLKQMRPARHRFSTSFGKSATVQGVS